MASISLASPSHRQRWFVAGVLLFFAAINVQYVVKIHHFEKRSAILRWQNQIHDFGAGINIWEKHTYPNPPIMALLLQPLMMLPPLGVSLVWFYLKVIMTLCAIHWVFRMVETPTQSFPVWGKALAFVLSLRPIEGDLTHGNINLYILFLVVAALYLFFRGKDAMGGIVLALAIACKLTPALFVPYFLWKRAWRMLAGCTAGLALFFFLVPGLFVGMETNVRYLRSWVNNMITPFVVGNEVTSEHNNQSLPGLAARMLTHQPSFTTYDSNLQKIPVAYHNFASLEPKVVGWMLKGCLLLFAAVVVWSCRTPLAQRGAWPMVAEFSIVILGMLLFSERTWKHHCVTLLLPFTVLAYYLAAVREGDGPSARYGVAALLAATVLLMLSTSTSDIGNHERFGEMAQVYGAYVWAFMLLIAALVLVLRRTGSRAPAWAVAGQERRPVPR